MPQTPPQGDREPRAVDATHVDRRAEVGVAETFTTDVTDEADRERKAATVITPSPSPSPSPSPGAPRSRTPRSTALVSGEMVGEYKVETKLGEGGMGAVYGAIHPLIGKRAAIKVLKRALCGNPEAVERFVLEARSVNQIGHPNIVDIFSFGELADGSSYFVMEWLRGESLAQRMARGRLSFSECLEILDGIIRGLEAAHEKGIVHRDLKPDNVFLVEVRGERPSVKLLDFGIAKLTGGEDNRLERTRTGALIGTPQYIAPEQARGFVIDHRADVYSLGVMAFEMFIGQPPFMADTAMDMISKHLHETPPRPSTMSPLPAVLDRMILEMLDKVPANRPELGRIREILDETRTAAVNVALVGTVPDATLPPGVAARRRNRTVATACAIGVVVAAGVVAFVMLRDPGPAGRAPAEAPAASEAAPSAAKKPAVEPAAVEPAAVVPAAVVPVEAKVTPPVVKAKDRSKGKGKDKGKIVDKGKVADKATVPESKRVVEEDDDEGTIDPFKHKKKAPKPE